MKSNDYIPNFIILDTTTKAVVPREPQPTVLHEQPSVYHHGRIPETDRFHTHQRSRRKANPGVRAASWVMALMLGGLSLGAGLGGGYAVVNNVIVGRHQAPALSGAEVLLAAQLNAAPEAMSMVAAVNRVRPSVVSINIVSPGNLEQGSRFFSPFFEIPDTDRPSSGTGIIFYENEDHVYILTNEHVIERATSIEIMFGQNHQVEATVKGRDMGSDLAVLYVPWASLYEIGIHHVATAEFGDSDAVQVGEFVMAIGNALGQGISTTQGVLSAHNIELEVEGRNLRVIQTDAAINPGNSGGPLINSRGQVVGINTVKISRPSVYGMGFAVTSNVAIPIIDAIMNETARPSLGIRGGDVVNLNEETAERLGATHGVFISEIVPNSAAYLSELEPHDIIMFFDGEPLDNMDELRGFIYDSNIGDTVILRVLREGSLVDVSVTFRQF